MKHSLTGHGRCCRRGLRDLGKTSTRSALEHKNALKFDQWFCSDVRGNDPSSVPRTSPLRSRTWPPRRCRWRPCASRGGIATAPPASGSPRCAGSARSARAPIGHTYDLVKRKQPKCTTMFALNSKKIKQRECKCVAFCPGDPEWMEGEGNLAMRTPWLSLRRQMIVFSSRELSERMKPLTLTRGLSALPQKPNKYITLLSALSCFSSILSAVMHLAKLIQTIAPSRPHLVNILIICIGCVKVHPTPRSPHWVGLCPPPRRVAPLGARARPGRG